MSDSATGLRWRAIIIALAGLAAYWNSLDGPFVYDDLLSIVENPHIREWRRLGSVLFPERELPVAGRPLVNLSFALNYAIGGLGVKGYHLGNIAIHLGCALLIFGIVRRTLQSPPLRTQFGDEEERSANLAFATALVWVLHPLNTEAVDYVTQRTELLMGLFYLSTLYAGIRAWCSSRPIAWQTAAVLACACGMACKESMVTAPVMVVLYDRIFLFASLAETLRARWRFYAALSATWLLLAGLIWSGPRIHSAGFMTDVGPWTYLLNQTVMIARYLRLAVWPRSLVLNYGTPSPLTLGDVLPYALLVAALLLVTLIMLVRRPTLGFLGAWFFITLAPASSFVPIATEVGAERRMYLPLVSLVALAVVAGSRLIDLVTTTGPWRAERTGARRRTLVAASALVFVATALAAGTVLRNREYASSLSLARTVIERYPTSVAHHMLGAELSRVGTHEEAVRHLREALPGDPRAHYALGIELFNQGRLSEAIDAFQRFVRAQPMLLEVVSARDLMGQAFARQKQWAQAAEQYRILLTMVPANVEFQGRLAEHLFAQQAFEEAAAEYTKYLRSRPRDIGALTNLGIALISLDRLDEAIAAFRRVVDVDPRNAEGRRNLANALIDHRDIAEATVHARQAVALRPEDPAARDLLGRTLALQGKIEEARAEFETALRIDPAYADARENLNKLQQLVNRLRAPARP